MKRLGGTVVVVLVLAGCSGPTPFSEILPEMWLEMSAADHQEICDAFNRDPASELLNESLAMEMTDRKHGTKHVFDRDNVARFLLAACR